MIVGANQSFSSAYTVPAGKTAYMTKVQVGLRAAAGALTDSGVWARPYGGVFSAYKLFPTTGGAYYFDIIPGGLVFQEKSDIIIRMFYSSGNNTDVFASYDLVVINNGTP